MLWHAQGVYINENGAKDKVRKEHSKSTVGEFTKGICEEDYASETDADFKNEWMQLWVNLTVVLQAYLGAEAHQMDDCYAPA